MYSSSCARGAARFVWRCDGNTILLNGLALWVTLLGGAIRSARPFPFMVSFTSEKRLDYLGFDEAIAVVADVYWRALEVATALALEAGDEDPIWVRNILRDGVFGGSCGRGSAE